MKKKSLIVLICIMVFLTGCSTETKNEEAGLKLENFNLNGACFDRVDSEGKLFCFNDNTVYDVIKYNDVYRATNTIEDTYTINEKNYEDGKFTSNNNESLIYGYILYEKDNSIVLWTTYYDLIEQKNIVHEHKLSDVGFDDVTFNTEKLKVHILGNDNEYEISNNDISKNWSISSFIVDLGIDKKDRNGNSAKAQGYGFYNYANDLFYVTGTDYSYIIQNRIYSVLYQSQVCYQIDNGEIQTDFSKTMNFNAKRFVVHFCQNF